MNRQALTVLLVEDDPNDILLIQRAFRRAHLPQPLAVGDGEQAVAYLSGQGRYADRTQYPLPSLVLLDLKMPRMDGFEFLSWLRAQPVLRRLPVSILTSSAESPDVDRAYELGANSYFAKPPTLDDLQEVMRVLHLYWDGHSLRPRVEEVA